MVATTIASAAPVGMFAVRFPHSRPFGSWWKCSNSILSNGLGGSTQKAAGPAFAFTPSAARQPMWLSIWATTTQLYWPGLACPRFGGERQWLDLSAQAELRCALKTATPR